MKVFLLLDTISQFVQAVERRRKISAVRKAPLTLKRNPANSFG
jgi:hypothetical protein